MVASRHRELFCGSSGNGHDKHDHTDLEDGNGKNCSPHPRQRFRDAIETTTNQKHAKELKKQLLENVDCEALEKFRKSDEEVGSGLAERLAQSQALTSNIVGNHPQQKGTPLL